MELLDKFKGALVGTLVGDTLGRAFEGLSPESIRKNCVKISGAAEYSDDTEMMIATAESLCRITGFDGSDMANSFIENYHSYRGYGKGTQQVLRLIRNGESWMDAGKKIFKGGSFGNGAAMRIAPVGCFYYDRPLELKKVALKSAQITHAHPLGCWGAVLQAYTVARVLKEDPKNDLNVKEIVLDLISFIRSGAPEYKTALQKIDYLLDQDPGHEKVAKILGNTSQALCSVPAAIYCFLSQWKSFRKAVESAVLLGGDADTIGAMTGAVAGAYHGVRAVPSKWWDKLENGSKGRDYILDLATRLWTARRIKKD